MIGGTGEAEIFEQHRRYLTGVAYRITGSWTDAEDIAQDVWLRWANAHPDVDRPRNWLVRVTVRASLDRLRRLKRRREIYLGPGYRSRPVWRRIQRTPRSCATPSR
jgi:RNA polymerase sigma-70 factor, ECF subfamily